MPITLDGSNGITTPTYGGADTSEYLVPVTQFKNRIINGDMRIDQRNAGASVTPANASSVYLVDRWMAYKDTAGVLAYQQISDAPTGFVNSLRATVTTADSSIVAADEALLRQSIEGFNISDLMWGTANARAVTLSFWVKSSLTGTFGGSLQNNAYDRSYPFSYAISVANTWEYKTIAIAGDTTGTWLTNNGVGIRLNFSLGSGSDGLGTAGAWVGQNRKGVTGQVNPFATLNATWQITGCQIEVGSTATSFDYRPYGTELQLCQRYFETSYESGNAVGSTVNASRSIAWFNHASSDYSNCRVNFSVYKRASPTIAIYNPATGTVNQIRNLDSGTNISAGASVMSVTGFMGYVNGVSVGASVTIGYHYTASAEL